MSHSNWHKLFVALDMAFFMLVVAICTPSIAMSVAAVGFGYACGAIALERQQRIERCERERRELLAELWRKHVGIVLSEFPK